MGTRTLIRLLNAGVIAGTLGLSLTVFAGDRPIAISYSGTGHATVMDRNNDGEPIDIFEGLTSGTLGNGAFTITSEFAFDPSISCDPATEVGTNLIQSDIVLTIDGSNQVFGRSTYGWLCLDWTTWDYRGEVTGEFVGGTGRFQKAAGNFISSFNGTHRDDTLDLKSIKGVTKGTLSLP